MEKLSLRLREFTAQAHRQAEGADFVKKLFRGQFTDSEYIQYLWALREIYVEMEKWMEKQSQHPALSLVFFPELFRTQSLNQDLQAWAGTTEPEVPNHLQAEVDNYIHRLKELAENRPELIVAHAYVRYLGDLSGGEMLGRVLQARFGDRALNFYRYDFDDFEAKKNLYRERLDQIGEKWPDWIEEICQEAERAFDLNGALFQALSQGERRPSESAPLADGSNKLKSPMAPRPERA